MERFIKEVMSPNHHPEPIVWRGETAYRPGEFSRDVIELDGAPHALLRLNVASVTARKASFLKGLFANSLDGQSVGGPPKSVRDVADGFYFGSAAPSSALDLPFTAYKLRPLYAR